MNVDKQFGMMAGLIGEQSRAVMLWHLLGGKALTATELAISADVSPQSASMHLNKLLKAGVLAMEKQGRHRYYKFSTPEAAYAVEAIANLIPPEKDPQKLPTGGRSEIQYCRTCYDHLAGKVGVLVTGRLVERKVIVPRGLQFELTAKGRAWFNSLEIDAIALQNSRRVFARTCLDWTERKHHLAGALGAAFLDAMLEADWVRRMKNSRAILLTPKGRRKFHDLLGLDV
jgi:DNA-binding transcriptional ArsR family regulator